MKIWSVNILWHDNISSRLSAAGCVKYPGGRSAVVGDGHMVISKISINKGIDVKSYLKTVMAVGSVYATQAAAQQTAEAQMFSVTSLSEWVGVGIAVIAITSLVVALLLRSTR